MAVVSALWLLALLSEPPKGAGMATSYSASWSVRSADGVSLEASARALGDAIGPAIASFARFLCDDVNAPIEVLVDYRSFIAREGVRAFAKAKFENVLIEAPGLEVRARMTPCAVAAAVTFDERTQIANAAGASFEPGAITQATFDAWAQDYANTVVSVAPERRGEALASLRGRVPRDVLWVFQQATQTTRGPFADQAMQAVEALAALARQRFVASALQTIRGAAARATKK